MAELPASLNQKILLVGQDKFIEEVLDYNLRRKNYQVAKAGNGRDLFELVENRTAPLLVVMALDLDYRSGIEVIDRIRTSEQWNRVPVLVLSRSQNEATVARAFNRGASDYVKIPFKLPELIARIERLLRKRP